MRTVSKMCTVAASVWMASSGPLAAQAPEPFSPFEPRAYRFVNSIAFMPTGNEMYFALLAREVASHRGESTEGVPEVALFRSLLGADGWSEPEALELNEGFHTYEPTILPDGSLMVFNSRRPYPDGRMPDSNDLWMSRRDGSSWGTPRRISAVSTFDVEESYGALAADGTLVFMKEGRAPDGSAVYDLFESRVVDGSFTPPVRHPVSSDRWGEGDPWISPDGRTLIFTRWDDAVGWAESVDLYISVRAAGEWSTPLPLVELNTDGADFGVAASPDGRWLYYRSNSRSLRVDLDSVLGRYGGSGR